jgi:hypothetical protein
MKRWCYLTVIFAISGASASTPGDQERTFLQEAITGRLNDVFLVELFGGYVVFPRTAVIRDIIGNAATRVEIRINGRESGIAYIGSFVKAKTKSGRYDVTHSRYLPVNPIHVETRGHLTVEYFGNVPGETAVVIYSGRDYVLLTGNATALLNEFVEASVALSGPPDVFSPGWHPLASWTALPSIGDSASATGY